MSGFCDECGMAVNLSGESPLEDCCNDCFEKLGRPERSCWLCDKPIPVGQPVYEYGDECGMFSVCSKCLSVFNCHNDTDFEVNSVSKAWPDEQS